MGWFEGVVSAVTETLAGTHAVDADWRLIAAHLDGAPIHLRVPLRLGALLLDIQPLLRHGARFSHLAPNRRLDVVRRWKASRIDACRNLIRLFETLVLITAFAEHEIAPEIVADYAAAAR